MSTMPPAGLAPKYFRGVLVLGATVALSGCSSEPIACVGYTAPCGSTGTGEACRFQAGCSPDQRCVGSPFRCDNHIAETACLRQPGCDWQPASCHGEPQACDSFDRIYGGADCERQFGCTWTSTTRTCSGAVTACDGLAEPACREQNGCDWYGVCNGTATGCGDWTDAVACGAVGGCRWDTDLCTGEPTPCAELPADLCAWQEGCHAE